MESMTPRYANFNLYLVGKGVLGILGGKDRVPGKYGRVATYSVEGSRVPATNGRKECIRATKMSEVRELHNEMGWVHQKIADEEKRKGYFEPP